MLKLYEMVNIDEIKNQEEIEVEIIMVKGRIRMERIIQKTLK